MGGGSGVGGDGEWMRGEKGGMEMLEGGAESVVEG